MPGPIDILEEHQLVLGAPPRDEITARGVYRREDGAHIVLPAGVQTSRDAPEVFSPGTTAALTVTHGANGWTTTLPSGDRESVRIVARVNQPLREVRLFTAQWPIIAANATAAGTPVRRVALVPREALARVTTDWTCTDDGGAEIACVSTARNPEPLGLAIRPARGPKFALPIALAVVVIATALVVRLGGDSTRRERFVGALAGLVTGAAVSLAMVGAAWSGWALALGIALPVHAALGALATRNDRSALAGGMALLVLPLLSVLDGRPMRVLGAFVLSSIVIALAAWRGGAVPRVAPIE